MAVCRPYDEVRTADVCRAARLPSITPAVSSTKPSIAAAPIPNADHANARLELGGTDTTPGAFCGPSPYFLLSASPRSMSARYSAAVMPAGLAEFPASPYLWLSRCVRAHRVLSAFPHIYEGVVYLYDCLDTLIWNGRLSISRA
jgi:hypothetical protein